MRIALFLRYLVLSALLALVGCSTDSVSPTEDLEAQASPAFTSTLVAKHSDKCLVIEGDSSSNGAAAEQRDCDSSEATKFNFVPVSGQANVYAIENARSGKCLDIFRAGQERGAALVQYRCGEGDNQHFKLIKVSGDYYQLEVQHSEQCVDVFRALKANGTKVVQYTCAKEPKRSQQGNQVFKIAKGSPNPQSDYDMRGNPNFSESQLSPEQRTWYDRMWKVIKNPDQYPNATTLAKSDDNYNYRGVLQDYDNALLLAFRVTGDLRLLDEVSRVSQLMRKELADPWRDTLTGDDGKKDGFLNWVTRYNPEANRKFIGKDTQEAYDFKAHAHVALFAWAFENNRDLKSPGSYNYAEQADFWEDYLVNHFEKKWRTRNGKLSGFPFTEYGGFHTYHSSMKWHHYMGKLTGKSAYTKEAERMADVIWRADFKETPSKYGTALVWSRGVASLTDKDSPYYETLIEMHPQGYARYVVQEAVDLHFEGFKQYASDSVLEKMARSTAAFVIRDVGKRTFARDIGGGSSRAGIPASDPKKWGDMTQYRFAESGWSFLTPWDKNSNDRISQAATAVYDAVSNEKYDKDPKRVFIPVGMFLKESLAN